MILSELFFHMSKKIHDISSIEHRIISLFEHYYIAWNNFVLQLGPESSVPKLHLSIKNSSIYQCLDEMNAALEILHSQINNTPNQLKLYKLLSIPKFHFLSPAYIISYSMLCPLEIIADVLVARNFLSNSALCSLSTQNLAIKLGSTAVLVLLADMLEDIITFWPIKNSIDKQRQRLDVVLNEFSNAIQKETDFILYLTQLLDTGIVWLDKTHMLLVGKDFPEAKIVSVEDFEL
ncbi:MAG: hypothetical protein ACRCSG_03860 [Cellulosilyticaceae bacterium]